VVPIIRRRLRTGLKLATRSILFNWSVEIVSSIKWFSYNRLLDSKRFETKKAKYKRLFSSIYFSLFLFARCYQLIEIGVCSTKRWTIYIHTLAVQEMGMFRRKITRAFNKQEIWAKLTRRAKAYSISSSVVIVSKIAYHLDSAHRDHNTHRP